MTDILLSIHAFCYGLNERKRFKDKNTLMWGLTNIGARFATWMLYVWKMMQSRFGITAKSNGQLCDNMVVSLTTYPPRIKTVWLTIDSLTRQTMLPNELVMHLSLKDFPKGEKDLPQSLLRYKRKGLKICWHEENLKPHKKYIYAFQEHPEKCVVTVDDDLYYRKDMLERLWTLHKQFPHCVCANITREIPNKADIPYKKWNLVFNQSYSPSHQLIGIGCGGILYPVPLFKTSQYADKEMIRLTSLSTDDLWLKVQELIMGIKVVTGDYYCHALSLVGSQADALSVENWQQKSTNDVNWQNLRSKFPQVDQIIYPNSNRN